MKRLFFISLYLLILTSVCSAATTSTNGYFYLPDVADTGSTIHDAWVAVQEATDGIIQANVTAVATSTGLRGALNDETGTGSAVFATAPSFATYIDIGGSTTGVRASGASQVGKLTAIGGEGLSIDLSEPDEIIISSHTDASGLRVVGMGFRPDAVTADPCGSYEIGAIFYNKTSNYHCFCNSSGADIKMNDNTNNCF